MTAVVGARRRAAGRAGPGRSGARGRASVYGALTLALFAATAAAAPLQHMVPAGDDRTAPDHVYRITSSPPFLERSPPRAVERRGTGSESVGGLAERIWLDLGAGGLAPPNGEAHAYVRADGSGGAPPDALHVLRLDQPDAGGGTAGGRHGHDEAETVGDAASGLATPLVLQPDSMTAAGDSAAAISLGTERRPFALGLHEMLRDGASVRSPDAADRDAVRLFAATETRVAVDVDDPCRSFAASCDGYLFVDSVHPIGGDEPLLSHRAYDLATMLLPASTLMVAGALSLMLGLRRSRAAPTPAPVRADRAPL